MTFGTCVLHPTPRINLYCFHKKAAQRYTWTFCPGMKRLDLGQKGTPVPGVLSQISFHTRSLMEIDWEILDDWKGLVQSREKFLHSAMMTCARWTRKTSWFGLAGFPSLPHQPTCTESCGIGRPTDVRLVSNSTCGVGLLPLPLSLCKSTDNKKNCLYLIQTTYMQYKQPLLGWTWRGDFGWRGIGWSTSPSVSSSTSSAVVRPRLRPRPFPRDRSIPLFGGTKGHLPGTEWQRDRQAGQNVWDTRSTRIPA